MRAGSETKAPQPRGKRRKIMFIGWYENGNYKIWIQERQKSSNLKTRAHLRKWILPSNISRNPEAILLWRASWPGNHRVFQSSQTVLNITKSLEIYVSTTKLRMSAMIESILILVKRLRHSHTFRQENLTVVKKSLSQQPPESMNVKRTTENPLERKKITKHALAREGTETPLTSTVRHPRMWLQLVWPHWQFRRHSPLLKVHTRKLQ